MAFRCSGHRFGALSTGTGFIMRILPSAGETALLVILNLQRYAKDRGKELSRFRMARSSLRRLAIRTRLEDSWIGQFIEYMLAEYGWLVFVDSDEFLFIKRDNAISWTKISAKRCEDLLKRLRNGDATAITDAEAEADTDIAEDDDDDGE